MILCLHEVLSGFDAKLVYRCGRISSPFAEAIARTFQQILEEVLSNGSSSVGEQNVLPGQDRNAMFSWNPQMLRTHTDCLHHLLESKVRDMPEAEAICAWDGRVSYAELDELATAAALKLVEAGVGPGVYVPFAYEKSLWTVVATYATMKASGAFVPLEPNHPQKRNQEILHQVDARIVVTSDQYAPLFEPMVERVVVISNSTIKRKPKNESASVLPANVKPSDPILVLFTSGSTGKPKGMVLEHSAICTHALSHGNEMGYQGSRVLQFAAHTFDVCIMDFFTTLLYGGCICIPSDSDRQNDLIGSINRMRADYAILTPSFAGLIEPWEVPTLKTLAIGGEKLSQDRITRWAEKVSLIQIYGPAEVGICLTKYMNDQRALPENVGYPLENCSCWLVDPNDHRRLVPFGAVGELVVSGPSLARGYLNDEAKTRASFISDLAWARLVGLAGARFYKTGDLLRYNTSMCDGSFNFVGRKDTQIKLRGQRMELGELEHHLADMSDVAVSMVSRPSKGCFVGELVVVIQKRNGTNPKIKNAHPELVMDHSLTIDIIRARLTPLLPVYMLPAVCLVLKSMPFVPSLKVDRKLVEAWLADMQERPTSTTAASYSKLGSSALQPGESTARGISAEVARMLAERDGVKLHELLGHDFNLQSAGVDSIQIISISMYVQRNYKTKIPLRALLSSKLTVRNIASIIEDRRPVCVLKGLGTVDLLAEATILRDRLLRDLPSPPIQDHLLRQSALWNVFLTGASGYLGSAILKQLLNRPDTYVYALMRCSDEAQGLQRLISIAQKGGWWRDAHASQLFVWKGDLAAPGLGLNEEQLRVLRGPMAGGGSTGIHSIIHNGAYVHYHWDFPTLKAPNLMSTVELLRITAESQTISDFLYVSGGRTPSDEGEPSHITASKLVNDSGYAQSKFVAEHIVRDLALSNHESLAGKSLKIVRPGYIVGSPSTAPGRLEPPPNPRDFLWRLVAGCLGIGGYNADEAARWLYVADVQRVASAAVATGFASCPGNTTAAPQAGPTSLPILDRLRFGDLWDILRSYGYLLEPFSHTEWMARLRAAVEEQGEEHPLFPVLHIVERESCEPASNAALGSVPQDTTSLEVVKVIMHCNVRHLAEIGFLPRV